MGYPPVPFRHAALEPGETPRHSFLVRGYLYAPARSEPRLVRWLGHLTDRRFVLEPEGAGEVYAWPWRDVIEFEAVAGSRAAETLSGIEGHMIHMVAKHDDFAAGGEILVFTAEPTSGARPAERPGHCAAFLEIADDLLLEAFESGSG